MHQSVFMQLRQRVKLGTAVAVLSLAVGSTGWAKVVTKTVDYKDDEGTELEGYAVFDDAVSGPRPGVIVVHDWRGLSEDTRKRAEMLAKLGYVAFEADIFGKGVHLTTVPEWSKEITKYKDDRALFRRRERAAYEALIKLPEVDPHRIAAIGYCFGGTGVIEMVRDGLDLKGVVSFHGGLDARPLTPGKAMSAKVLALCGADDPFQKESDFVAFEAQLRDNNVDYEIVKYGHAVHAFTQTDVDQYNLQGAKYNAAADRRSWQAMCDFLQEIFAEK
jgi:dienelactone hydrolase